MNKLSMPNLPICGYPQDSYERRLSVKLNEYLSGIQKFVNSLFSEFTASSPVSITASTTLTNAYRQVTVNTSGITVTLPELSTVVLGSEWTVTLGVAGSCTIAKDAADTFIIPTSDTTIQLIEKGTSLDFRKVSDTQWGIV